MHATLAEDLGGAWGYRRLDTLGVIASARRDVGAFRSLEPPDWLGPDAAVHARLGTTETTAQVDPSEFTKGMMAAAIERGARLQIGCVRKAGRRCRRHCDGAVVGATNNIELMMRYYEETLGYVASDYCSTDAEDPETRKVAFYRTDPEHHSFAVTS